MSDTQQSQSGDQQSSQQQSSQQSSQHQPSGDQQQNQQQQQDQGSQQSQQQSKGDQQQGSQQQSSEQSSQQQQQQEAPKFAWPENWRQHIAGEDKSLLAQLERFTDPGAVFKQNRELQAKLSSGKVKYDLPENATEEQKAQYRKDNGLPEAPEGYEIKLPDGLVVGEAEKPLVAEFQKFAHATNMSPADFNKTLGFYYQLQADQAKAQATADVDFHDNNVALLTQEWGGEAQYKRNTNIIGNLMATVPADVGDNMLAARTPDGRMLGDNPQFNKWLVEMGRALNPAATLMPNSSNPPAAVNSRIKEIEGMMYLNGQPNPKYWGDEAIQKELRDLYSAQGKEQARAS